MLLQGTVVAVNMVKLTTLVCIVYTLACTIVLEHSYAMASLLHLPYARANIIFENYSITDWQLSLLGR